MKFASERENKPVTLAEALSSARETRALEIGSGIISRTARLFREQFGDRPALVVTDSVTRGIAGDEVVNSFGAGSDVCLGPFVYSDPKLYAEFGYVTQLEEALKQNDSIPVAVGSGTINDLTKLAAHRVGRPYMCVATAASMDGYTAFGASITHKGSKQTFVCPAPQAVLADLKIIQAAPAEMNASGYADLLAKTTAGADWILADALGAELIQPEAWRIVQGGLREMLAEPQGVPIGETNAISHLTTGLMLAGFAMQSAQSSRAASGAEHQFSHLWDMQHHTHNGAAPSHGFKVGIATLAVTALYECLFAFPIEDLDIADACAKWPDDRAREEQIRDLFPEADLRAVALQETAAKSISRDKLRAQLELLRNLWLDLKTRLQKQLLPFNQVKAMLRAAGAAFEPEQIGISRERLRASFLRASLIRRRFTVLDVVSRAGLLDEFLNRIFSQTGPWAMTTSPGRPVALDPV
jgi:glycerol-1-phosphate dehydrogenase [NAD(P)+]